MHLVSLMAYVEGCMLAFTVLGRERERERERETILGREIERERERA